MIKQILLVAAIVVGFLFFYPATSSQALKVYSPAAKVDISTGKVSFLSGRITEDTLVMYGEMTSATASMKGDRVIFINSPGGDMEAGLRILAMMELEKLMGTKTICVVTGLAASMAFNILSNCDVRLATATSAFMFHSAAYGGFDCVTNRCTPDFLKKMALALRQFDKSFRDINAKALKMTDKEYDDYSSREYRWTTEELIARGYLNGVVEEGGN